MPALSEPSLSASFGSSCRSEGILGSQDTDDRRWNAASGRHQEGTQQLQEESLT